MRTRILFSCLTALALVMGCGDDSNKQTGGSAGSAGNGGSSGNVRENPLPIEKPEKPIAGEYIFVLDTTTVTPDKVQSVADELLQPHGGTVMDLYEGTLIGFSAKGLDDDKASAISRDLRVASLGQNGYLELYTVQENPVWGLDLIDGRYYNDKRYEYYFTGKGVHAYVIDSGIRSTHQEFTGRIGGGISYIADGKGVEDCHGHGTHVAATLGGTTYGVAKDVTLHPVRVADCNGTLNLAGAIAGIDWVIQNRISPAVINMSAGTSRFSLLDQAAAQAVAAGIPFVAAAGNPASGPSLAVNYSPGRVAEVVNVGAINNDYEAVFGTNYGAAIDVFAPGNNIISAGIDSDTGTATKTGTSMAAPHVAGVLALYLEVNPSATPSQVTTALTANATMGLVKFDKNAPNRVVYSRYMEPKDQFINSNYWDSYFTDAGSWDTPHYSQTISFADINGDKKADVCGRAGNGIVCELSTGTSFTTAQVWTPSFADAAGFTTGQYYWGTIRLADVNGDGKVDVCGRYPNGIYCGRSTGVSFELVGSWESYFSDANGWSGPAYYWATIQYPDVNGDGKADVCGRAGNGIVCELSDGTTFGAAKEWSNFYSDANGWGVSDDRWATIRFPDVNGDGKMDVCGRLSDGIFCSLSNGTSFDAPTLWGSYFTDANNWGSNRAYWATIQFGDINGDKKADVCGRAGNGIVCELSTGSKFDTQKVWTSAFDDASGWNSGAPANYVTIGLSDLNGDGKADVCGRGPSGAYCATSRGASFDFNKVWGSSYNDAQAWASKDSYYSSIRYPDVNGDGRADICGRAGGGLICAISSP